MEVVYIACFGRGETEFLEFFLRVFTVFERLTVCSFSPSFTEFFKFKFLQLELLPLRVVTVVKVWVFYKVNISKIDCKLIVAAHLHSQESD